MKNIFIIGPVASGKTTISKKLAEKLNMSNFDTGILFRFLGWIVLNKTQIVPDFTKIRENNQQEIKRIMDDIYQERKLLIHELEYISLDKRGKMAYKEIEDILCLQLYSTQINYIIPIIAQCAAVRKIIIKFIRDNVGKQRGDWILTGHNLFDLKLSDFIVIYLHVRDDVAAYRLIERNNDSYKEVKDAYTEVLKRNEVDFIDKSRKIVESLYEKIYIDTSDISVDEVIDRIVNEVYCYFASHDDFMKYQKKYAFKTSEFVWLTNPFLYAIKKYLQGALSDYINLYPQISTTDLIYQVLIHACAYSPEALFKGDSSFLREIDRNIKERNDEQFIKFYEQLRENKVFLNETLINKEIKVRTQVLINLVAEMNMEKELILANTVPQNNIKNFIKKRKVIGQLDDCIIIKKIDYELSYKVFRACHYLHAPRIDEYAAYGIFISNEDFPIAAVSFSLHDRNYKKQILDFMGLEPQNILEVTRSWCSNRAPKNIQSYLLEYAMNDLCKEWRTKKRNKEVTNILQGFTTTVDPNLDFHASSFLGCNFKQFALRPARYNYINEGNINYFRTRREINLHSKCYFMNKINILPLNEMIRVFDKRLIEESHGKYIYQIDDKNYERIKIND